MYTIILFAAVVLGCLSKSYVNSSHWEYDFNFCDNMEEPECIKVGKDMYNYTVTEIRRMTTVMRMITERRIACTIAGVCPTALPAVINAPEACVNGYAGQWQCSNINLLSFVPLSDLGAGGSEDGNDIWGWVDPADSKKYAITGQTSSSSIVDVTNPTAPEVLCYIPSQITTKTSWRDMKVTQNANGVHFITIVADRSGQGVQYFPLHDTIEKCRANKPSNGPYTLSKTTDIGWSGAGSNGVYTGSSTNTHNIVGLDMNLNSRGQFEAGTLTYGVGSGSCSGGLMAMDWSNVNSINDYPAQGGCYSSDGYSHDAECWEYSGPDTRYTGRIICVGYNENSITITDSTTPGSAQQLSRLTYSTSAYTHQGWRTTDQSFLLMNDELDESRGRVSAQTTYIVDIRDLQNPTMTSQNNGLSIIDHNLYIRSFSNNGPDYAFETNYRGGLRVYEIGKNGNGQVTSLNPTGYFKTWGGSLAVSFNGAWSNYPYFDYAGYASVVVIQDIETGLYIVEVPNVV